MSRCVSLSKSAAQLPIVWPQHRIDVAVAIHVAERCRQRTLMFVRWDLLGPVLEAHLAEIVVQSPRAPGEVNVGQAIVVDVGNSSRTGPGNAGFFGDIKEPPAAVVL